MNPKYLVSSRQAVDGSIGENIAQRTSNEGDSRKRTQRTQRILTSDNLSAECGVQSGEFFTADDTDYMDFLHQEN